MRGGTSAAGLWFIVVASTSGGAYGACSNGCGAGLIAEGETCLLNLGTDVTNAGCNAMPIVFGNGSCAVTICGTVSTYDADTNGDLVPDTDRRDTDWYLINASELQAADLDGNGVVQVLSTLVSEFDGVTFFASFNPLCANVTFPGSTGFSGAFCGSGDSAQATLVVADHPQGVVVFVSSGQPDGTAIYNGFECLLGQNDYTVFIECVEPPESCAANDPLLGPCGEANPGVPGCEDPECCKLVCDPVDGFNPLCCLGGWFQQCANAAISLGCAAEPGPPVCIATGDDSAAPAHLEVCPDPYGAWTAPGYDGAGDRFNPVPGTLPLADDAFTAGTYLFRQPAGQRELLATSLSWQNVVGADASLQREITSESIAFDDDGDTVADRLASSFHVTGTGVDLSFDLDQAVDEAIVDDLAVGVLTQTYTITNNGASPVDFTLVRVYDGDLLWTDGGPGDFSNDAVGTASGLDLSVFLREAGTPVTAVTMSSASATAYVGAKNGIDPDGVKGPGPAMGFGTGTELWDAYGMPGSWRNFIAGVDYDIDGESGPSPPDCTDPCDAHIVLEIPVSLAPLGSTVVVIRHTYGGGDAGEIGFDPPSQTNASGAVTLGASGDLNGDGLDDVVGAIPDPDPKNSGHVQVFLNLGLDGGVWQGFSVNPPILVGSEPSGIRLGLFNGDPDLDMAVTNAGDDNVLVFLNTGFGDGTFLSPSSVPVGDRPSSIATLHANLDRFIDLAVANEGDGNVVLLLNDGNGNFGVGAAARILQPPVGGAPRALSSGDFDNNKDDDLAGGSTGAATEGPQPGNVFVLLGQGGGEFAAPVFYPVGDDPRDLEIADLDDDGFPDIAAANMGDGTLSILANNQDGSFGGAAPVAVGAQARSVLAADLDGDVLPDLAVAADDPKLGPALQTLKNESGLQFGALQAFLAGEGTDPKWVISSDVDGDGVEDLVSCNVTGPGTGSVTVLLGSPVPPPSCPWDCDGSGDGNVNIGDLLALLGQYDPQAPGVCAGGGSCDYDGNGCVDVTDLLKLLAHYTTDPSGLGCP